MLSIGVGLAYLVMTWSTIIDLRVARLPTRTEKERFTLLYTNNHNQRVILVSRVWAVPDNAGRPRALPPLPAD